MGAYRGEHSTPGITTRRQHAVGRYRPRPSWERTFNGKVVGKDGKIVAARLRFKQGESPEVIVFRGMLIVCYVLGATLWMEGLPLTMALWDTFALVVGLFLARVGVAQVAMLATPFKGMWRGWLSWRDSLCSRSALAFSPRG